MELTCPLCERDSETTDWDEMIPHNPAEIPNEIANLEQALEAIDTDEGNLQILIDNQHLMCRMCQTLFDSIEDESDRLELEDRINKQILKLEEQLDNTLPGQI